MKIFELLDIQYNSFVQAVKNNISTALSKVNATYGNSTIFGQIINVVSSVVQNIMLYIEDAFVEQNIHTAQRKKSIYGLAALSGYQPSLGKAAGVQLKFMFMPNNVTPFNVMIRNHETLTCTQNGMQYNVILPQNTIVLSSDKDNSTKYIYAVQGRFETQTFAASGGKYYTQNMQYAGNLDPDYMTVYVNDEVWEHRVGFYDMDPDGKQYTYKVNYIGGIDIIFGNNIHGRQIYDGDTITIVYLIHDGEQGNLDATEETYFVFNNSLSDTSGAAVDGNSIFYVSFATDDAVIAGSNSETKEQVRQCVGLNSRALVLASPEHYKNFISKFSFCGYNRTWSEPGSMVVNSIIMKNYRLQLDDGKDYFNLTEDDFYLSDVQKQSLINALEGSGQQLAGTTFNIFNPEICKYAMFLYVRMKNPSYDKDYMENKIRTVVGNFFANVNSDIYIPKSDIIGAIKDAVDDIDGVNVYFLSEANEEAIKNGEYTKKTSTYNPSKGTYDVKVEKIAVGANENPGLGLDAHGNIYLDSDEQFPVLMGGWSYKTTIGQEVNIPDALTVVFEDSIA